MTSQGDRVRRKFGDRRIRPRFDVVGDLWGTLETVLPLPLRNVGRGGALIESRVALPAQSVHRLTFRSNGADLSTEVRVRYVKPHRAESGDRTFLIGLEFTTAQPALLEQIDQWLIESQGGAARMEA